MNNSPSAKLAELQARMKDLHQQQAETLDQLARAVAIRECWPEAFALGGGVSLLAKVTEPQYSRLHPPSLLHLTIKRKADGETRTILRADLPLVLIQHFDKKARTEASR